MRWFADFAYPQFCLGCRKLARGGLCRVCLEGMPRLGPPTCRLCGHPTPALVPSCRECRGREFYFDEARQAVAFGGHVREAIHRFKYSGEISRSGPLALLVAARLELVGTITWVPADPGRLHERGFDHGRVLAEAVAALAGLRVASLLERVRSTPPQVELALGPRVRNQEGALRACLPPPPKVTLVDDVFTTGSTVSEAARALKAAGAGRVRAICIARTLKPAGPPPYGELPAHLQR